MDWPDFIESDCRKNYSFFSTTDYLRNGYHCMALLSVSLSLFTFYAILRMTPFKMKNMKTPLLVAHICCTNLDLMLTVYSAPMVFCPSAAGVSLGILGSIGIPVKWQAYWGQVSIAFIGISIIMLYENRQSQIPTIKFKITNRRVRQIYFGANYLIAFVVMLPFYLEDSDQLELRKYVLKRIPCPTIDFFDKGVYVLLKGGERLPFLSVTIILSFVTFQIFFFPLHTFYHLNIISNSNISEAVKTVQRKMLKHVTFQILIPLIAICFPIIYTLYSDQNNYYSQALNNHAMLLMSTHGVFSTVCTLCIYEPYREFIKEIFLKKRETGEDRKISMVPGTSMMRRPTRGPESSFHQRSRVDSVVN